MSDTDTTFRRALSRVLDEIFDGPPASEGFLLNPGDVGLLRQLESVDARAASQRSMPGRTTVAAHVDHLHYGLTLLNRWAAGEANPWASADWDASWQRGSVNDEQWRKLRDDLHREARAWRQAVVARQDWDDLSATGALASAAHTAYHLGAIRQILAAMGAHRG